jgi:predicted DNA-binding transcriptional regulator AlpA
MKPQSELPRYIRAREVRRMLGNIARDTLRELVNDGTLPKPVQLTRNIALYDANAVVEAVRQRGRGTA